MRLDGVKATASGRIVFVVGTVQVPTYLERVAKIVDAFQRENPELVYQNLVTVDPQAWVRLAERVEREIGSPEITVRVVNRSVYLEGTAESDFEADRGVEIAKTYFRPAGVTRAGASEAAIPGEGFVITDMLRVLPPAKVGKVAQVGPGGKRKGSPSAP
jgi:Flp pilus assembly secretin CpaC